MIAVLSHRLEGSKLDDLTLGVEVTALLVNLPEFRNLYILVPHLRGVLEDFILADKLVDVLLPKADVEILPVVGGRFFAAFVDVSKGRDVPFQGVAPTKCRALLAAAFRAYDHSAAVEPSTTLKAGNGNAPACLFDLAEAVE